MTYYVLTLSTNPRSDRFGANYYRNYKTNYGPYVSRSRDRLNSWDRAWYQSNYWLAVL